MSTIGTILKNKSITVTVVWNENCSTMINDKLLLQCIMANIDSVKKKNKKNIKVIKRRNYPII